MDKITITNAKDFSVERIALKGSRKEDGEFDLKCEVSDLSQVSDGYHTIAELYDHRITLFIALCKTTVDYYHQVVEDQSAVCHDVWRSKKHGDGKDAYEGWFIMGINRDAGEQISYHLPLSRWEETNFAETLEQAPEWDGHTSADVLERLKNL